MSVWSIDDKKKTLFLHFSVGVCSWGKKKCGQFPHRGSLSNNLHKLLREAIFPPSTQPFTSGSYRAIEHSPGTSTSPTSATKKHFKATLPAVPTLFHLSNTYKTFEEGQTLLRGATAHLLPASAPLKMLLFLLKKEYTINLYHLLSWAPTIRSREAQTRTLHLDEHHLKKKQETLKKAFPSLRVRLPEREDESSGNDAQEINMNQLSVWGRRQQKKKAKRKARAGDPWCCRKLEASAVSEPCPPDWSFE